MFQPLFVRPLMANEREVLLDCSRSPSKEEAWRADVVLQSAEGKTAAEISLSLGFHTSNIKKWIRKFNEEGLSGIAAKKRGPQGGPRPRFSHSQIDGILTLSKTDPAKLGLGFREWTPQKLATVAVESGIVDRISHVTVRQLLKRSGSSTSSSKGEFARTNSLFLSNAAGESEYSESGSHLQVAKDALSRSNYQAAVDHLNAVLVEGRQTPEAEASTRILLTQALEEVSRYEDAYKVIGRYEDPAR